MNVLVFASRKGGSGKSTLAAHLVAHVHQSSRPCLLIDDDPQGSLTLWNGLRQRGLPLRAVKRGIADTLKKAKRDGAEWVFIDTPPNMSASVIDAINCATMVVIPCRPGVFDINAVLETIGFARQVRPTQWLSMVRRRNVRKSNPHQFRPHGKAWPSSRFRYGAARLPIVPTSLLR
jgi:chromosome partitioning protein